MSEYAAGSLGGGASSSSSSKTSDFGSTRASSGSSGGRSRSGVPVILFDAVKSETHGLKSGLRKAARKLKSQYKVSENRDAITLESLARASCVVFASPRERFEAREFDAIKQYLAGGGSVLFLTSEGADTEADVAMRKNLNLLLFQYGIEVNNDAVVRTVFMPGYFHPKECYVSNGVVNIEMANAAWRLAQRSKKEKRGGKSSSSTVGAGSGKGGLKSKGLKSAPAGLGGDRSNAPLAAAPAELTEENGGLTFVYPYGATLSVKRPAVATLSTGPISYPLQRPVVAFWDGGRIAAPSPTAAAAAAAAVMAAAVLDSSNGGGESESLRGSAAVAKHRGRIAVIGSTRIFDDEFIAKEQNATLLRVTLQWLMAEDAMQLAASGGGSGSSAASKNEDILEQRTLPDTEALAERLRSCLQSSEPLPHDYRKLYQTELFGFSTSMVPEVVSTIERLGLKNEPLRLIPPVFETPLPARLPAVFPPTVPEPTPPPLDQFDLDEEFSSERLRLAQLTNKCASSTEDDLKCVSLFPRPRA